MTMNNVICGGMFLNFITGRVGSGKSTVANELRKLGYPVISLDSIFSDLLHHDPVTRATLYAKYGDEFSVKAGEVLVSFVMKFINDATVHDWVWNHLGGRVIEVIERTRGCIIGEQASFVETPVIYPWIKRWLHNCGMALQPPPMMTGDRPVIQSVVREFRIETSDDTVGIERKVAEFIKMHDLYLGTGSCTERLLFHSLEEIRKNEELVDNYRSTMKALTARHISCENTEDKDGCLVVYNTLTYKNDAPDSPAEIAKQIAEEVRK